MSITKINASPKVAKTNHALEVAIYHNPACGTSRNTLAMIRASGVEPEVIEYLKTPLTRKKLTELISAMGLPARALLREKGTPYAELGLDNLSLSDDALINAMLQHPILINRPIVVTAKGVKLCRPSELVLEILENSKIGTFTKEDGEVVRAKE
jgi:arsenate reductase (glutaredoxin)